MCRLGTPTSGSQPSEWPLDGVRLLLRAAVEAQRVMDRELRAGFGCRLQGPVKRYRLAAGFARDLRAGLGCRRQVALVRDQAEGQLFERLHSPRAQSTAHHRNSAL